MPFIRIQEARLPFRMMNRVNRIDRPPVQKQVRQIEPDIVAEDGQDDGEHLLNKIRWRRLDDRVRVTARRMAQRPNTAALPVCAHGLFGHYIHVTVIEGNFNALTDGH